MLGREREVNEKLERNLSSIVEWLLLIRFSIIVIIILLRYLLYRASISSIQTQFKRIVSMHYRALMLSDLMSTNFHENLVNAEMTKQG